MATRAAALVITHDNIAVCTWTGLLDGDDGNEAIMTKYPDKTVQASGDFTASGAITMQGSNDGTNWATLTSPSGDPIVLTDTSLALISENPLYIRPLETAGTGVNITVIVVGTPR